MSTKRINGIHLEKMIKNGLANLQQHEEEANRLNVFPVPDGDTGTNMVLTLGNGVRYAKSSDDAGAYLRSLSDGMLLGARGNSGVILSQFFRGFAAELARSPIIGPGELRNGLIRGYRAAYEAVVHPVEGTILSVVREGIEHIRTQITRNSSIESILSMYIAEMRKTLSFTPEMLSVLKEAGVVDSGAYGFILIAEGMLKCLYGEVIDPKELPQPYTDAPVDLSLFNENSEFADGYCTEFILQRLVNSRYQQEFNKEDFISELRFFGNSIAVIVDGMRVKVHIHTLYPSKVIAFAQQYGEFLTFKMENMQVQHNEHDRIVEQKKEHKPLAVIAVVNGEGLKTLFSNFGCDIVIDGGTTMNTSSAEFLEAFDKVDADAIVVLPNNPNIILAARQAVELSKRRDITVVESKSAAQGYFAMAMDIPDSDDVKFRISQMQSGIDNIATVSQTVASRDYSYHEISCRKGDEIALLDSEIVSVGSDYVKTIVDTIAVIPDIDDKETCVLFRGRDVPEEREEELYELLSSLYPMMDFEFIDGGQEIYHWIIGLA
ncbi:MAG: DAK2 domain-containing protein [Ruminococcus sp.]|uniref:DAK2 domain-containing protein n=1 Tax=Ruminococcus sp. TaxID=41978 RepID=UPI00287349E0|nr:DAK2 domain-containing protein [Ruminococcus sp.]MBQ3284304.1 DAK2 domain-containing protein [Ruminococcus sp.]